MRVVFFLRGIPGCGKSSVADDIVALYPNAVNCCADDYFIDNEGNYKWDAEKIGNAHGWCKHRFKTAITSGKEVVVVSNTSTTNSDVNWYRNRAISEGYTVYVLTVENRHDGIDVHNVPEDIKEKMRESLKNSIKL